ncbi:mitochondrial protein [Moniliophthora roreri]|nr:mitochondrial protein [Moniliophthora roreri]
MMQKQCVDILLHILTKQVKPDFCHVDFLVHFGLQSPRLSKAECQNKQHANEILSAELEDKADIAAKLTEKTPDIYIQLFSDLDSWYRVSVTDIKAPSGKLCTGITGCECPDFEQNKIKCKHMFLTAQFSGLAMYCLGGL